MRPIAKNAFPSGSLPYKIPLIVLVGLFLLQFFLIWFYAVDIPYWDDWGMLHPTALPGGLRLEWLFVQQNEHRPLTTRLVIWILYRLTGWNLIVHQLVNFLIYGLILSWIVWFAKRTAQVPVWICASFVIFLLSPLNYENLMWPVQSVIHLWLLFFLLSTYYLFTESQKWSDLIIGSVLSVLSIYSFGSGVASGAVVLLIFVVFKSIRVFSARNRKQRIREALQMAVVLVITVGTLVYWLIGYSKPQNHPPVTYPYEWRFWKFFLNNLAFGFGIDVVSTFLGAVCVLIVLLPMAGILIKRKSNLSSGEWATFAVVVSILAVFGSIAFSRAELGAQYAKLSRYFEFGMILVPASLLSWSFFLKDRQRLKKFVIAGLWFFCFLTFGNNWVGLGPYGARVISFGAYPKLHAAKQAGIECVKTYYLTSADVFCPTIYPSMLKVELEQARNLNVSFYQRLVRQNPLISLPPKIVPPIKATTIGLYRPSEFTFYLRNSNSPGLPDLTVPLGTQGDVPLAGDWDGNGTTTIGVYRPAQSIFHLRNTNSSGMPDLSLGFGSPGDIPVVGDWDGDGTVTIGVYRPSESIFYLRNANSSGSPDLTISFGLPGDIPVLGDWDGNGTTTIGVYRPSASLFYLRATNSTGEPDLTVGFGSLGDIPIAGDWDGNGIDTIGIYRSANSTFYLLSANSSTTPGLAVPFGDNSDIPIVGDWDGK